MSSIVRELFRFRPDIIDLTKEEAIDLTQDESDDESVSEHQSVHDREVNLLLNMGNREVLSEDEEDEVETQKVYFYALGREKEEEDDDPSEDYKE
jgi:hypothetical protein